MTKTSTLLALAACLASGCCRRTSDTIDTLALDAPTRGAADSGRVDLSGILVGIDRGGRASLTTLAGAGDIVVSSTDGPLGGSMFLASRAFDTALAAIDADLRAADPGSLLVGQAFSLTCAANPDGCIAYDAWSGATASATITIVAPQRSPPPLFTLSIQGQVVTKRGEALAFDLVQGLDLAEMSYSTGQSGDCS